MNKLSDIFNGQNILLVTARFLTETTSLIFLDFKIKQLSGVIFEKSPLVIVRFLMSVLKIAHTTKFFKDQHFQNVVLFG